MAYIGLSAAASASYYAITGTVGAGVVCLRESNEAVGRYFFNDTNQTVYLGFATRVTTGSAGFTTKVTAQSLYEIPHKFYYGPICAVWQTAPTTGALMITETFTVVKYP